MAFYNDGKEKNIIRLGGGLPTFSTPGHILDAMKKEVDRLYDNRSIYGPPAGTLEFREAIADYQKFLSLYPFQGDVISVIIQLRIRALKN